MSIKKYLEHFEDLSNKKILITGGTSGIGLSLTEQLLSKNATVVILARNMKKAEEVKNSLLEKYKNAQLSFIQYDQSDDQSVINAAKEVAEKHNDFYALVLNAGITQQKKPVKYVDGYPLTIKTNLIGLSLFLETLLPLLNEKHRFIFQGSLVAGWHLKKIKSYQDKNISFWQQYFISKAGVEALYYYYLEQHLNHEFLLVEPGISVTNIIREFPPVIRFLAKAFAVLFSNPVEKASLPALLAVSSTTKDGSYIIPRGFLDWRGYPKIKKFPPKRRRPFLVEMIKKAPSK